MNSENVTGLYQELGFEETEIEEGLEALAIEFEDGSYGLITDDDGGLPASLKQPLVFAYYTPQGSFEWSTSFKNSFLFQEVWSQHQTPAENLVALQDYRASKGYY